MRAGLDERRHVVADQAALADVDQRFGGAPLLGVQLVFARDVVEVRDNPAAQIGAVPDLEQQPVQPVRLRRRVLVELEP
jgi:hypothetical protein